MPRMSPELLLSSRSYLNPLADRELDLRGYQIPAIENLAVNQDSLDSLDLTDNAIRSLINFPKMKRLKHLYVSNNPVTLISPNLPQALPNLTSLVLSHCNLSHLNQLFLILKQFNRLEFLVLTGNPVCKVKLYRDWCIYNCTKVRMLDFKRVKDKERKTSTELFYDPVSKGPTAIAQSLSIPEGNSNEMTQDSTMASTTYRGVNQQSEPGQAGKTLTTEERERIKKSIEDATSVEEVRRLKRMLDQGFIPREDKKSTAPPTAAAVVPDTDQTSEVKEIPPSEPIQENVLPIEEKNPDVEMENGETDQTEEEVKMGDEEPVVEAPVKKTTSKKRETNKTSTAGSNKNVKTKAPARTTRSKAANTKKD